MPKYNLARYSCLINKKIKLIKLLTIINGCFFVKATENIYQWTHPDTLNLMNAEHLKITPV